MRAYSSVALLAITSCFILTGCDTVRSTRQTVTLKVLNTESGDAIANADVRLKNDFDRQEHTWPHTATEDEWYAHARKNWEQAEWFHAKTDENGSATVNTEYTALDGTRGNVVPLESRDWVTGEPFLVEISADQMPLRTVSIEMTPGNNVADSGVSIRVDDVRPPTYIPTQ